LTFLVGSDIKDINWKTIHWKTLD